MIRIAVVSLILASGVVIYAQAGSVEVTGEVRDSAGALISDARISITQVPTAHSLTTDVRNGAYSIVNLKPGTYNFVVDATGFKRLTRENVRLQTGERVRLDFILEPGAISESVVIRSDASLLRTETGSLGQGCQSTKDRRHTVERAQLLSLVGLVAGVAQPPPTSAGPSFSRINGGRPRTNEYHFDGISVLQPEPGQVAFFPIVEAIQWFKVDVNSPPFVLWTIVLMPVI